MPLLAWCYFVVVFALACLDTRSRLRHDDTIGYVITSAASSLCSLAAIVAFWHPSLAAFLGRSLFITTLFALVWDCMTMKHDSRAHIPAPNLSPTLNSTRVAGSRLNQLLSFSVVASPSLRGYSSRPLMMAMRLAL